MVTEDLSNLFESVSDNEDSIDVVRDTVQLNENQMEIQLDREVAGERVD